MRMRRRKLKGAGGEKIEIYGAFFSLSLSHPTPSPSSLMQKRKERVACSATYSTGKARRE
jgi:hypothetical protein